MKKNISCLEKNQVLFLDKNSFSSKATLKNRSDFIKTFIQTESSGELCGVGIDIRLLTDCFNEVKEVFNFKIFNYVGDDLVEKLQLQDKILSVNPNIPNNIKQYLNWYFQLILDKVLLIAYLYENENFSFVSNKEFLGETVRRLSMLDGKEDLFLGMGEIYYFKNNRKPLVSNYLVSIKSSASKVLKVSLYERQLSTISGLQKVTRVNYPYFDIIKIDNILISEGTFDADFYFEITTPFYEGINILLFDNVLDEKFEYKQLIKKEHQNGYFYFRYRVSATFTFFSRPENYPFDKQVIFISYSLTNVEKFGMLQLIKVEDINKNFISNGWNILGFRSGIIRKKEDYRPVFEDRYKIISEQNRIAIIMERPSSFTIIKILVPLSF